MICPRCKVDLAPATTREHLLIYDSHRCARCKGYWVDAEQKAKIESQEKSVFVELRHIPSPEAQQEPLACPQCEDVVMEKVGTMRDKKVVLDTCPNCHKFWLDGGEMEAIQEESLVALVASLLRWRERRVG